MTTHKTIRTTVQHGLCVSCGACKAVCPQSAISMRLENGQYLPNLNAAACVPCERCVAVCPGIDLVPVELERADVLKEPEGADGYTAYARNPSHRREGSSGGIVTALILELLKQGAYDSAFVVPFCHVENKELFLEKKQHPEDIRKCAKSTYLPVSAQKVIQAFREAPGGRYIVVATPCVLLGLKKAIQSLSLPVNHTLFLGLFCDLTMNRNFLTYMESTYARRGETLRGVDFRNKEKKGWPGNPVLTFSSGRRRFLARSARTRVKPYFQLLRCLFCYDKLNALADISCGDCYLPGEASPDGKSSVIVRSPRGRDVWKAAASIMHAQPVPVTEIAESQKLQRNYARYEAAQVAHQGLAENLVPEQYRKRLSPEWRHRIGYIRWGQDLWPTRKPDVNGFLLRLAIPRHRRTGIRWKKKNP